MTALKVNQTPETLTRRYACGLSLEGRGEAARAERSAQVMFDELNVRIFSGPFSL